MRRLCAESAQHRLPQVDPVLLPAHGLFSCSQHHICAFPLVLTPIGLRRNWTHRFLTLESAWGNKLRHACAAALLKKLASGMPQLVVPLGLQRQEAVVPVAAQTDGTLQQVGGLQCAPCTHLGGDKGRLLVD